jgi:protein gp37
MYFVNSMSDLFHKSVPEQFIADCFTVMEKAHWHRFQVLTKRPERMAEFTQKRYANIKPFPNIWLGTSTEDQEAFDKRMPHLKKTKAAVRWLSAEPLLGPIKFGSMADLDWIVVGGESGSDRQMQKSWATAIRDECKKSKVPYFFKQWGNFNELGKREREKVHPATLDGVVHDAYPEGWEK